MNIANLFKNTQADPTNRQGKKPSGSTFNLKAHLRDETDAVMVWINAEMLDKMWQLNEAYYLESYNGEPKDAWFSHEDSNDPNYGIIAPEIWLETIGGKLTVGFKNGRHRTRWLIQCGFKELLIGMYRPAIVQAKQIGLARKAKFEDQMSHPDRSCD